MSSSIGADNICGNAYGYQNGCTQSSDGQDFAASFSDVLTHEFSSNTRLEFRQRRNLDSGTKMLQNSVKSARKRTSSDNAEGSDSTDSQSCIVCGAEVDNRNSYTCKACIIPGQPQRCKRVEQLSPWRLFLHRTLPAWMFEPEFMMHGKPNADRNIIHRHTDSLFSTSSGFTNYRGLLNLALILLVLSNARLFLENLIKYGILINPFVYLEWFIDEPYNWPNVLLIISSVIFPFIAFWIECALCKEWISDHMGITLHVINDVLLLTYPAAVIYIRHPNPAFSSFTLGIVTILFLKLISYAHVNYWCRTHQRNNATNRLSRRKTLDNLNNDSDGKTKSLQDKVAAGLKSYPGNINLEDLVYFILAPTLCYELNFPRSQRIRKRFLVKRIIEMSFLSSLMLGLVQQWIVPAVNNSLKPLAAMDFFRCMERLLKLAVPNHFIWLIFFYSFFHSALNVIAELLRFGDREFYRDWWNAETVSEFWQNWNIPVHRWASRHVYKPLMRRGCSRLLASTVVFIISAFFHEYLVSVPLRMFKFWAFSGMLMQVPLAYVSAKYLRGKTGNILMWLSLILGQPVAILAYVHDYYIMSVIERAASTAQ